MANTSSKTMMLTAIKNAAYCLDKPTGGPFGAVVVHNGAVIAHGRNEVTELLDPTAHAEVQAIRNACKVLGTFDLSDCVLYASCEPCPMCLCAMMWARIKKYYYGAAAADAAAAGFDDSVFYKEVRLPSNERQIESEMICNKEAVEVLQNFKNKADKKMY